MKLLKPQSPDLAPDQLDQNLCHGLNQASEDAPEVIPVARAPLVCEHVMLTDEVFPSVCGPALLLHF